MKHLLVPTLLLLVSISQVQAQVETSPHEHTVTHGHGNYVDHIHTTTDHSHTVQPRDMETPEEALARHAAGAWHEDLLPGESSALLDHTGVPYLGPVLSDEVDDLFANDPHDPRIRLLHTHSFNHDDGQDHQHRHIYIHGHVSSGTCPGLNVCIHEHTDNVAQFRQHEDHVIGQEHIHWEQSGRVYGSHVVRHRDEHFHVAVHTHDGLLRHHHYLDHTHSYDRLHTTHDWHEAQALLPDGPIPSHRIINVTGAGQDVVDYTTHAHSSASSRSFDFVPDPESQKQEVDGSAKSDDAPPELTVSFTDVPAAHTGSVAFTLRAEFSEPVTTDETAMRDDVLVVIGGVAMDARRVDGRGGLWEITVEPDSDGEVQVFVAPDGACAEVSAVCTVDGRQLAMANWIGVIIPGPTEALTASFTDVPATHAGSSTFAFWIEFSDPLMTTGHGALRDDALVVTGGAVTHVREVDGLSDLWEITIAPDSEADVMILLVAERACTEAGAVCTSYGRRLANGPVAVIPGPPADEPSDEAPSDEAPQDEAPQDEASPALTASFTGMPAEHAGSGTFTFQLAFNEPVAISYKALRDESFAVTGGQVTRARRVDSRSDLWEITVEPDSDADVTILLAAERACEEAGAVCTADGRRLANELTATVPGPAEEETPAEEPPDEAPPELTASFTGVPAEHAGSGVFTFRLAFNEPVAISYKALRDESFAVTGGQVTRARRVDGRSDLWEITVEPDSHADVTVTLASGRACDAAGGICTADSRRLSNTLTRTVPGPAAL